MRRREFITVLGGAAALASIKASADHQAANVLPIIREIQKSGASTLRDLANALNARGIPTARGGKWYAHYSSSGDQIVFSGERFLHTGEVVGSIPTAPIIFQALLSSVRQYRAERYANPHTKSVGNRWDLFTDRSRI
jgi:hypothetical protein